MAEPQILVARLNARLQPMHRGEIFEDPLEEELKKSGVGSVTGGGTQLAKTREIEGCDVEIEVKASSDEAAAFIIQVMERLGAPKGSKLILEGQDKEVPFGTREGLAVYLNGTDLPEATYRECDSNFVYSEFDRLLDGIGRVYSYWQGPQETAYYMYGDSFSTMRDQLQAFLASYPLCERCRIVQVA